jgi:AsmA-like protein
MIARAEPILRKRVIETLSLRFKGRVELAELHVWVANGINVQGKDLRIFGATDPNPWEPGIQPLIAIGEFHFQTGLRNLFLQPMRVDTVFVRGLTMNIPPKNDRKQIANIRRHGKISVDVSKFIFASAKIVINTPNPNKAPLEFDISDVQLTGTGHGKPLRFDARLINPRPTGDIHSTGLFGPFNEQSPRDTAVSGDYSFTDADLGTIRGLGGILSSQGHYSGRLDRIAVEGETDTPDFRLAVSGHRVPLHTEFRAIVDGTDGDTYLESVRAKLRRSLIIAKGKVIRMKAARGRDIELNVRLDQAQIEDLLALGVKTEPPVMTGKIEMNCRLSVLPGDADVANRMRLSGDFKVSGGSFENEKVQTRIDDLSLRSRGETKLIGKSPEVPISSDLKGSFRLESGILSFSSLNFEIPGTQADLTGQYSLDGRVFDFHGILKMQAKLSQMTKGWKSILLKPVDPFFHKDGAGTEVPFKITGTHSEPHFGLDFHHRQTHESHSELTVQQALPR